MKTFRLLLGYLIGFTIFAVLVPDFLSYLSRRFDPVFNLNLISNFYIRLFIAIPVFCLGILFAIWSNIALLVIGKGGPVDIFNVAISPRSEKLVITGPYKYSRNPMVFGAICIYFSISVYLNSFTDILFLLVFIPIGILYLKATEEKRLLKDFGEEFLMYKSKVAMIIPFTKIKKRF
jgi:protein-S-isoprenylcysteine O-methyltransferase Ste14